MCFRDSPVVQGNCILALSGLAVVLSRYERSLSAQSDGQVEVRIQSLFQEYWARGGNAPWMEHQPHLMYCTPI